MPDDTVEWTDAQREELRRMLDGGMSECPGRLALCGVPCGCDGKNPSHRHLRGRIVRRHDRRPIVDSPEEIAAWLVTGDA